MGTAAAAGTYPTDTEACANLGHFLDCTIAEDQATCEANTNCQFVKDEEMGFEGCTPSDAINVVTENALNNATAALESHFEICGAFTVEEDCVGACAWAVVADAKTKTAAAETLKEAIPTADLAEADAAKLDFLAAAAINGQTVKKVVATLDADEETSACATTLTKMGLTSDDGACTATAARRRKLLASYSTSVLLDPAKVDETAAAAAVATIEADTTVTDENPVDEIEDIPNIDTTAVATFKTSAVEAAEANVAAEAYEAEEAEVAANSAASSVAAVSAIATAALAAAACVFA